MWHQITRHQLVGNKTSIGQPNHQMQITLVGAIDHAKSIWSNAYWKDQQPRKSLEHKPNDEKLEDDPEVTRVFDKKLIKRWESKPIDIVTEFTYMEMMDTGTPLSEAWVSIHTDDLDSVGTNDRNTRQNFRRS